MFGAFAAGLQKRGINPFRTGIGTTLLMHTLNVDEKTLADLIGKLDRAAAAQRDVGLG